MRFELLTLGGSKFAGTAASVQLTTVDGEIGILPHHESLVAQVKGGPVIVKVPGGGTEIFATFGGLLEVENNVVRLLADEADHAEELVAEEIEAALARAKELRASAKDKHELARAQEQIDRQAVRLGVARMHRRIRPQRPTSQR
jgi:F-type H+-transporting ATPase subunit epsilon